MAFISLRGAAYYAASVHICVGIYCFVIFFFRLITPRRDLQVDFDSISMGTESLAYFGLVLPLGIVIFRGIDKESKSVLTWSAIVFFALQLFGCATRVRYNYVFASSHGAYPYGERTMISTRPDDDGPLIFKGLGVAIFLTAIYLVILFFYIRQLSRANPGRIISHQFQPVTTTTTTTSVAYFVNPPEGIGNIQGVRGQNGNTNPMFNGPSRSYPPCYHSQIVQQPQFPTSHPPPQYTSQLNRLPQQSSTVQDSQTPNRNAGSASDSASAPLLASTDEAEESRS